jgi:hypothetical protein
LFVPEARNVKLVELWRSLAGAEGDVLKGQQKLRESKILSNNELYVGQPSLKVLLLAILPSSNIAAKHGRPRDGDVLPRNTKKIVLKANG